MKVIPIHPTDAVYRYPLPGGYDQADGITVLIHRLSMADCPIPSLSVSALDYTILRHRHDAHYIAGSFSYHTACPMTLLGSPVAAQYRQTFAIRYDPLGYVYVPSEDDR